MIDVKLHLTDEEIEEVLTIPLVFGSGDKFDYHDEYGYPEEDTLDDRIEKVFQRRLENIHDEEEEEDGPTDKIWKLTLIENCTAIMLVDTANQHE